MDSESNRQTLADAPNTKVSPFLGDCSYCSSEFLSQKQQSRTDKGSESQSRLYLVEEYLEQAKEKLSVLEKKKLEAMQELNEAQKLAEEANEKLAEALSAQRRAEESSEIEKFREASRVSESNSQYSLRASYNKIEELEKQIQIASGSLNSVMEKLESKNEELHNTQIDIASLKEKIGFLEICIAEKDVEIVRAHSLFQAAKEEALKNYSAFMDQKYSKNEGLHSSEDEIASLKGKIDLLETSITEKEGEIVKSHSLLRAAKEEASKNHRAFMDQIYGKNKELQDSEDEIDTLKAKIDLLESCIAEKEGELVKSHSLLRAEKEHASKNYSGFMHQIYSKNEELHNSEDEIASLKDKIDHLETYIAEREGKTLKSGSILPSQTEMNRNGPLVLKISSAKPGKTVKSGSILPTQTGMNRNGPLVLKISSAKPL